MKEEIQISQEEARREIEERIQLYHDLFNSGDYIRFVDSLYLNDGRMLYQGKQYSGRKDIKEKIKNAVFKDMSADVLAVTVDRRTAVTILSYTAYYIDGRGIQKGKCLTVWERKEGKWYVKCDMYDKED